jgi:uncharacterized protein with GYD domain
MEAAVLVRSLERGLELRKGGEKMKYFLVLSTLTDEGRKTVLTNPERIRQVNKAIEAKETKIVAQYALLGAYDFVTIIQAKDNIDVLKAAVEMGSRGTIQTITIPAIPIDEFIEAIKA